MFSCFDCILLSRAKYIEILPHVVGWRSRPDVRITITWRWRPDVWISLKKICRISGPFLHVLVGASQVVGLLEVDGHVSQLFLDRLHLFVLFGELLLRLINVMISWLDNKKTGIVVLRISICPCALDQRWSQCTAGALLAVTRSRR